MREDCKRLQNLLPCPFCGAQAGEYDERGNFESAWFTIRCSRCGASTRKVHYDHWKTATRGEALEKAASYWNLREGPK